MFTTKRLEVGIVAARRDYHAQYAHAIAGLAEREAREAVKAGLRAQGPSPWTKAQLISLGWPCRSGYGLNYLIDIENAVIIDVEPTPAHTYDEVESTKTMHDRAERRFNLKPKRLATDTTYGSGRFLGWLVDRGSLRTSQFAMPASVTRYFLTE